MKVLVACEESQTVCKAFRELGHGAYSCDIKKPSGGHPEWHILNDALKTLEEGARGTKCDHVNADSCGCTDCMNTGWIEPPIVEFMQIWAGTIKKSELDLYGWKANPYVWRIYFERCDKEGRVADGR